MSGGSRSGNALKDRLCYHSVTTIDVSDALTSATVVLSRDVVGNALVRRRRRATRRGEGRCGPLGSSSRLVHVCCLCKIDNVTIDEGLLSAAREAGARAVDAEREANVATADYHRAIRRLQLSGATMREIASALNLSHQRVQQIVDAYGGGRRWRRRKPAETEILVCTFCGTDRRKTKNLVAGPGIYICDRCVRQATRLVAGSQRQAIDTGDLVTVGPRRAGGCGFCGKDRSKVEHIVTTASQPLPPPQKGKHETVAICNECLLLCGEIINQESQ